MLRWAGRVAVVTGASSGIGAAVSQKLVKKGLKVIGLARRVDIVKEAAKQLQGSAGVLHAVKCDLTKEEDILAAFSWTKENLGGVDALINSAGVTHQAFLADGETSEWRQILDVNLLGLSICTREAVKSMKERGVDDGHIVHINSIAGHSLPNLITMFHMYGATKHGVTALTEGLRRELVRSKSNIRVTSLSPGFVRTDLVKSANMRTVSPEDLLQFPSTEPKDIADAVTFILGAPPHVQVREMIIAPTGLPF